CPSFQRPSSAMAAADPRRWSSRYYYALAFFVLALLSKSMVVTLPLLLLVLDFWPLERFKKTSFARLVLEKWPFFLSSAGGCVVTLLTQPHVVLAADHFGRLWRLGNALMAYADYLGRMIYPVGLELLYPPPPAHLSPEKLCISVIVLLGISAATILARRKHPWLLAGWLWYLIAFLPVIDIMQTGDQARADRYTYLPQIGLTFLVAWEAAALARALPFRRIALGCAAGAVLVALSVAAHAQARFWKNSVSIWSRTLSRWPGSYIAHCNLGIALADRGQATEALAQFHRALLINPRDAKSMNNLGKLLTAEGKLDAAIDDFHQALELAPDDARTLDNLSVALAAQGKADDAARELQQALKVQPEDAHAYYNLGNLYGSRGDYDDAAQNYERALEINRDFAEAHCNLGLILARQGNADAAIAQYERALRLKPHYLDALNDLGGALTAEGDLSDAAVYYRQALALKPDDPNMLNNLGVILARQGKLDDALDCFHRALQFDPSNASSYNNLGIALASQGKMAQAIENLRQALALARARNNVELEDSIRSRLQRYQNAPPSDREILKKF
ncbi:MAG: tetratricopeptide repeat protein, partial [Limisphaerales bacterium]